MLQKSDRPGAFVGILRVGLGPYLEQAVGLLGEEAALSEKVQACTHTAMSCMCIRTHQTPEGLRKQPSSLVKDWVLVASCMLGHAFSLPGLAAGEAGVQGSVRGAACAGRVAGRPAGACSGGRCAGSHHRRAAGPGRQP